MCGKIGHGAELKYWGSKMKNQMAFKTILFVGLTAGVLFGMGASSRVEAYDAAEKVCSFRGTSFQGNSRRYCWSLSTFKRSSTWTKKVKICGITLYTGSVHDWKNEARSGLKLALVRGRCSSSIGARKCNVVCRFRIK